MMPAMTGRGRPADPDILTPAEWEVVDLVRHGVTNRRIAELRHTSLDAAKTHVEHARTKLGGVTREQLRHWPGVPRTSHLRRDIMPDEVAPADIALSHVGQVSLTVSDIERSVSFYRDMLRLPHLFTAGQLAFFDADGTRIMLDALPEARGQGSSVLYFTVADIHAACRALGARGLEFSGAPHMIYRHPETGVEEWMVFFTDPDGNTLALMSAVSAGVRQA
jgi:predicted enzyme related to lactoylglutathione lyase/DNA-binding CsgD family transcriptional regulator